jgi:hypothetical protein
MQAAITTPVAIHPRRDPLPTSGRGVASTVANRVRDEELGTDPRYSGMDYSAARDVQNGHAGERSIVSSRG